ncbi:hypothetical protein PJ900_03010 (plasmid) [Tistrella mobilis]|uniref:hypothetical protein n=1 Tax=Tistrella mobilis TaxID=171437 RepID=UPI0012E7D5E1|nr:hypothetical protein [Tistrella mobilis]
MANELYFPHDEIDDKKPNFDIAADYLELVAFFSEDSRSFTKDLINAVEIGAEDDYENLDNEMTDREEIVSGAVRRIDSRRKALNTSYPFYLDENGDILTYVGQEPSYGHAAYMLCLILSHLKAVSPILHGSEFYPTDAEIIELRKFFQYFATAALAAEVNGRAWSFGHPRPDRTSFHTKLSEIWEIFRDGVLQSAVGAPERPQDDQIDVFAARLHPDGLPGFLLAAGQVATGNNWREKSLRNHVEKVFPSRWFGQQPVTTMICYHIIPFTRTEDEFVDDCRILGNVLHRLRVPYRVAEAQKLHQEGVHIEAFDQISVAVDWIRAYARKRSAKS